MSRRVIQPPGGSSSIFMGEDYKPTPPKPAAVPVTREPEEQVKKQTDESKESTFAQAQGTQADRPGNGSVKVESTGNSTGKVESTGNGSGKVESTGNASGNPNGTSEFSRNKDRQKSSILFGDETASESAARNKGSQVNRGYNLITGEAETSNGSKKAPAAGKEESSKPDNTSIKVHHPPGGKSSGPLW